MTITATRLSKGHYQIKGSPFGAGPAGIEWIDAPTAKDAIIEHLLIAATRLQEDLRNVGAKSTETAVVGVIGTAIKAGGIAELSLTERSVTPYISAAKAMGYEARSISSKGSAKTFLTVAADERGLRQLQSRIDAGAI